MLYSSKVVTAWLMVSFGVLETSCINQNNCLVDVFIAQHMSQHDIVHAHTDRSDEGHKTSSEGRSKELASETELVSSSDHTGGLGMELCSDTTVQAHRQPANETVEVLYLYRPTMAEMRAVKPVLVE